VFSIVGKKAKAGPASSRGERAWLRRVSRASLCILAGPMLAVAAAQSSPPAPLAAPANARVVTMTYLKAVPGKLSQLERYIRANWFAMDEVAEKRGLFVSHLWLDTGSDEGPWNAIVMVTYRDARGFAGIEEEWREIRAAHREVLIDGAGLAALGRVVDSREFFEREPFVKAFPSSASIEGLPGERPATSSFDEYARFFGGALAPGADTVARTITRGAQHGNSAAVQPRLRFSPTRVRDEQLVLLRIDG